METDYLVTGCGASAMAFVDVMLRESDATFTIVDRRAAPGGHWNDAYPFVRLHQPSASYGVSSRALGHDRKDLSGFNAGLYELASGIEVADYFHQTMRDTFLPTGRVSYHPLSDVTKTGTGSGEFVSLLSGEKHHVTVRRKHVDATLLNTSIPLTHTRKFDVAPGIECIPPNDLARRAAGHTHFTVLGAGKTAIDTALWLLANGANPDAVSWVLPRDPWLINRENFQPGDEFFEQSIGAIATQYEVAATATSVQDLCERMERAGNWLRLDPTVWPSMCHGATVTTRELALLRKIGHAHRGQRVRRIDTDRMSFADGTSASCASNTLFIDCTARALEANLSDSRQVFEPGVIRLYMIRQYQPTFSAALIGHLEATIADDAEKAALARPVHMTDTVDDWIATLVVSMANQGGWGAHKDISEWLAGCRLDLYSGRIRRVPETDTAKRAILGKIRANAANAVHNLRQLVRPT
jgi:hypothetical protein